MMMLVTSIILAIYLLQALEYIVTVLPHAKFEWLIHYAGCKKKFKKRLGTIQMIHR